MYAILFNLDHQVLQTCYGGPGCQEALPKIDLALRGLGFTRQTEGFFLGDDSINAVKCVLAVQAVVRTYPWFAASVRDLRMFRIEEVNDLRPALDALHPALAVKVKERSLDVA